MAVLGVDACKSGWVGIRLDETATVHCARTIAELVERAGPSVVIAVDIPIGLPGGSIRQADLLAKRAVGPRGSSVFITPPRVALGAATHAEATELCRQLSGRGLSQQAFALGPKILEAEAWERNADVCVVEVHPELSFVTLAGRHLPDPKTTWAGFEDRRRLLADAGIVLHGDLGLTGQRVGTDDVLDAAVAAWTADRVSRGSHLSFPDPPEEMPGGSRAAICA